MPKWDIAPGLPTPLAVRERKKGMEAILAGLALILLLILLIIRECK